MPAPDLNAAMTALRAALGDFLHRDRPDGVFHVQVGGPGSVPGLHALDLPELHLDLLPGPPTASQHAALSRLGYRPLDPHWTHPSGWRLVLLDEGSGWRAEQQALQSLLGADRDAAARYAQLFRQAGRTAADDALRPEAAAHHARTVGFRPALVALQVLNGLDLPCMLAGGLALDLHLNTLTRPHDDVDLVLPRDQQGAVQAQLQGSGWRLDAAVEGEYRVWQPPLPKEAFQVHARHPDLPDALLLDLMFSDLTDGLWHYRRDPALTLPMTQARRVSAAGLPFLTPEAVLLFKAGRPGRPPRGKDERDFHRVHPQLSGPQRTWLRAALQQTAPGHAWLERL